MAKSFPERIFLAKIFFDEHLIHYHRRRRQSWSRFAVRSGQPEIGSVKSAAGEKWNVQRLEEIRPDREHVRFGTLILRRARPVKHSDHQAAAQKRTHRIACRLHARYFGEAPLQVAVEGVHLRAFVADQRRVDSENQDVVGIESNVDAAQILEGTHQQSGADEHNDGKRDLRNHQRIADAEPFSAGMARTRGARVAFLERRRQIDAGAAKSWSDAEKNSREQ